MGWAVTFSTARRGLGRSPPRPLLAVPNVTAHLSTVSEPIIVLLVPIEGLTQKCDGWLRGTAVERWSLTADLSLSCARPAADLCG